MKTDFFVNDKVFDDFYFHEQKQKPRKEDAGFCLLLILHRTLLTTHFKGHTITTTTHTLRKELLLLLHTLTHFTTIT